MAPPSASDDVTALLAGVCDGDADAARQLWTHVYPDLRQIAHRALR